MVTWWRHPDRRLIHRLQAALSFFNNKTLLYRVRQTITMLACRNGRKMSMPGRDLDVQEHSRTEFQRSNMKPTERVSSIRRGKPVS